MFVGFRFRILPILMILLFCAGALAGCRRDKPNGADVGLNGDSVKQSLDGLKPRLSALNTKFATLHEQFDPLPPNLPGFSEVRTKFYGTDEGLGRLGAKIPWLSSQLDSALKSGNREELQQISKDIARTYDDMRAIDQIALELVHQVLPFQKMIADLQTNETAAGAPSLTRVLPSSHEVKGITAVQATPK